MEKWNARGSDEKAVKYQQGGYQGHGEMGVPADAVDFNMK